MYAKTDDLITRFLLGELSDEERAQVEERFLADNDFFEEVLSAEDALIDQYLLGKLNEDQQKRAETLFNSSLGQKREVEFTKELIAAVQQTNVKKHPSNEGATAAVEGAAQPQPEETTTPAEAEVATPAPEFSLITSFLRNLTPRVTAIAGVAILLLCFSLAFWILRLYSQKSQWEALLRDQETQKLAAERSNEEARTQLSAEIHDKEELSRQLEMEKEKRTQAEEQAAELVAQLRERNPELITSVLLTPTTLDRSGNSKTVTLKAETKRIQLQLALDSSQRFTRYTVLITTFDGRRVWSKDSVVASQSNKGVVSLMLPSSLLSYEDYRITLQGLSANGEFVHVADYIFKVRK